MALSETLELVDKVSGPADRMAAGVGKLEDATAKASRALSRVAPAAKQATFATNKLRGSTERAAESAKVLAKEDAFGFFLGAKLGTAILSGGVAVAAVGAAIGAATKQVYDFVAAVGQAAELRGKAKAIHDSLSGGRGEQVLEALKKQAIGTGQSFDELTKQTTKARRAGIGYGDAFKLNFLRGDLLTVTDSAGEADAAIAGAMGEIAKGRKASDVIDEIAKKYRVAGTGADAVTKSTTTFGGAMTRLREAPSHLFDSLGKKATPQLDALGKKVSTMFDNFNKSGKAEEMIDMLAEAVSRVISAIEIAIELAGPFWQGFKEDMKPITAALESIDKAMGKAFGNEEGMNTMAKIAKVLGQGLAYVVTYTILLVGLIAVLGAAMVAAAVHIGKMVKTVGELGGAFVRAGADVVSGLVKGITDGIGKAVAAARKMVKAVTDVAGNVLQLGSPSKLFAQYGRWTSEGLAKGIDAGAPQAASAAGGLGDAVASSGARGLSGGATGGSASTFNLTVQVSAEPGATASDGERLAAGIVPVVRREVASWMESQMLGAGA